MNDEKNCSCNPCDGQPADCCGQTAQPADCCKQTEETPEKPSKDKKCKKDAAQKDAQIEQLQQQIKTLQKERDEKNDLLLRTAAEFDNFKKRETAARATAAAFVKGETLKALLPCIDNINRAMAADDTSADYAKGITMTVKSLMDALEKLGLEQIDPKGEPFDVNLHQAVMRVDDDSVGANMITEVLQPGYKLGDQILRHAMVKVANCDM